MIPAIGFTVLLVVATRLAIPLPGAAAPITLQTLVVLLAGALLGLRWGTLSVLLYLLLRAIGTAVSLEAVGIPPIRAATVGYLIGFLPAAAIAALAAQRNSNGGRPIPGRPAFAARLLGGFVLAHLLLLVTGVAGLIAHEVFVAGTTSSLSSGLQRGVLPFLPGLAIKSLLACGLVLVLVRVPGERRLDTGEVP